MLMRFCAQSCRKKYCARCLIKFYNEIPNPKAVKSGEWSCPGCRGLCTCAACRRVRVKTETGSRDPQFACGCPRAL